MRKKARTTPAKVASREMGSVRGHWRTSVALLAIAWVARELFLFAGPDSTWPYSVYYKGDALVWLQSVVRLRAGMPFEGGVPLRPPGMRWLVDQLWDGTPAGVASLKQIWVAMGAVSVLVLHRALLPGFGARLAALAAGLAAVATGGLILSSSLGNETPYLLLVLLGFLFQPRRGSEPSVWHWVLWGALHAAATLVRVEHALFVALLVPYLALVWRRERGLLQAAQSMLVVGVSYALLLLPWHLSMWGALARFNAGQAPRDPVADQALASVEARTAHIVWQPAARAAAESWPPFLYRSASAFLTATVQHRARGVVGLEDLSLIEDAFGVAPAPLRGHPFGATYGALNFYLANNPDASAGFSRAALDRPPPLTGGAELYAPEFINGMPPRRFSFEYPPHLEMFNRGYPMGIDWITSNPGDWARLAASKLARFGSGASLGLTGYGLPLGSSGIRRPVDLVVPSGLLAKIWRIGILAGCMAGILLLRSSARGTRPWGHTARTELVPWILFAVSKILLAVAFFGYARQGALLIPLVALLWAAVLLRCTATLSVERTRRLVFVLVLLGLGLEGLRCGRGVHVVMDGAAVESEEPGPPEEHRDRDLHLFHGARPESAMAPPRQP